MSIVSVNGNPKVLRCTRCNSFISARDPEGHTRDICDERLYKKAHPGPRKTSKNKKLRLTPKRKDRLCRIIEKAYQGKPKSIASAKRAFGV